MYAGLAVIFCGIGVITLIPAVEVRFCDKHTHTRFGVLDTKSWI